MSVIALLTVAALSAIILGNLIAQGDILTAYLGLLVVVGLVALQQLKSSFWLLLPFAMVSNLPAISIVVASLTLGELWICASMGFVGIYWVLERRKVQSVFSGPGIWMYSYLAWALLILVMNPVGLAFTGAATGGFRFYLKIILGFIAFFIIANSRMGELNAKRMTYLLILGVTAETGFKIVGAFVPQVGFLTASSAGSAGGGGGGGFYGWQQLLAILPALIVPFVFARYTVSDLLQPRRWWVAIGVIVLFLMVLFSGKRSLAVLVILFPGILLFIRGKVVVAGAYSIAGLAGFLCLLGVHFSGVALPQNTQRILSVIPGVTGFDHEVTKSAENDFRDTLNRYAILDIRERPIFGEGFKVDFEALYYLENSPNLVLGVDDHIQGAKYAVSSAWHNTWLGMSADFGIPAAIIYALLILTYIRKSFRLLRQLDQRSYQWTLVAGLLAIVIGELLRSWQFGHASITYWQVSWKVGVLFAVENWLRQQAFEKVAAEREGRPNTPELSSSFSESR